jgi:hypothetical protein
MRGEARAGKGAHGPGGSWAGHVVEAGHVVGWHVVGLGRW